MRLPLLLSALLTAAACGGGGGGPPPDAPATVSGRVVAQSITQLAQRLAPDGDAEPNDFAACLRLNRADPEGRLDAATDPVDAFRYIAQTQGRICVRLEADDGVEAEAVLHDLESGRVACTLDVAAGTVYDVVVSATSGAGRYRATVASGGDDLAPRALPQRYMSCGDGHIPGEVVVATVAGVTPEEAATHAGLECVGGVPDLCLLRAPIEGDPGDFAALCETLVCCARVEAGGLVRYAEPNFRRRLNRTPNDSLFGDQWGMLQIRAPQAWDEIVASTIIIAVIDSGIRAAHPDLAGRLVPGFDFVENDSDPHDPTLTFAHGTQTAGVAAAAGDDALGVAGVVWDGRIMPLRAFDTSGFGTSFNISNAIRYAAGLSTLAGNPETPARATNQSFASSIPSQAEESANIDAKAAGVVHFAAAGNDGTEDERYPAAYDSTVGVTATGRNRRVTNYSNSGDWVRICGPGGTALDGVRVPGINSQNQNLTWVFVNGTSFAAPHAAGTAALMMALDPTLTPDEVETILTTTAQDIEAPGFDNDSGFGIVDAYAAILAVLGRDPPLQPQETIHVRVLRETQLAGEEVVVSGITSDATLFQWEFEDIEAGDYRIVAGTDRDDDGDIEEIGEVSGSTMITLTPGETMDDVTVVITPQ